MKILITGANSYIGTSVEKWLRDKEPDYVIDTLDMIDANWKKKDFSQYDVVYHVAGIAHADVGKVSEERKAFYYKINTNLAIETAEKAKKEGVKQFIFMSSMIVYGENGGYRCHKVITANTEPKPLNYYGDSKWQADKAIQQLADADFKVAIIRPPMIYGKGSKGNYPVLSKMARKLPIFPNVNNQRSMLHIDNLCEFIRLIIVHKDSGIFFPQNAEYSSTSNVVQMIAECSGHKIILTKLLAPCVWIGSYFPGKIGRLVNKAFGNQIYDHQLSVYPSGNYHVVGLKESITKTEC